MTKSLSICAFSILMLLGVSLEAHSQTSGQRDRLRNEARARNGYYNDTNRRRPPSRSHSRVDRNRPDRHRYDRHRTRPHTPSPHPGRRHGGHVSIPAGRRYTPHRHSPFPHNYLARRRYLRTRNYADFLRSRRLDYFYRNWIMFPSHRQNGYFVIDDYPYYVHNGYRHRYSHADVCDYQLVDRHTDRVIRYYNNRACSYGYDECARDRDYENDYLYEDRYFCAETHQY